MAADKLKALIAIKAYEFWESEGQRHGRDQLHWLRAEKELLSRLPEQTDSTKSSDQEEEDGGLEDKPPETEISKKKPVD